MVNYSRIKLRSVRTRNVYLLVLFGLLSFQQIDASKFENNMDVNNQEAMNSQRASQDSQIAQRQKIAQQQETALNDVSAESDDVKKSQQAPSASTVSSKVANFARITAATIATTFSKALDSLDSATGLPTLCNDYIGKPVMDAWLQARKLNGDSTPTPQERGLLNTKIDNIVKSVVQMYNKGLSTQQIGIFVQNSVQLVLYGGVVGMGAAAGGGIAATTGFATGAVQGVGDLFTTSTSLSPGYGTGYGYNSGYGSGYGYNSGYGYGGYNNGPGFFTGMLVGNAIGGGNVGDDLADVALAGAVVGTAVVAGAAAVGGIYGGVTAIPGGVRTGADYTSRSLQSLGNATSSAYQYMKGTNTANNNATGTTGNNN